MLSKSKQQTAFINIKPDIMIDMILQDKQKPAFLSSSYQELFVIYARL